MFASPDRKGFSQITAPARRIRLVPRMSAGRSPRGSRAEGRRAQLGMRQPQIVDPLDHMVGKLVRQGPADAVRRAVGADQVDAGDFRLLAAVLGKTGGTSGAPGADGLRAVALVEPFRLHAHAAGGRACRPPAPCGTSSSNRSAPRRPPVWRASHRGPKRCPDASGRCRSGAYARHRVADRQGHPPLRQQGGQIDRLAQPMRCDHLAVRL
jgi:hypothetical protein